jgi:putative transposase
MEVRRTAPVKLVVSNEQRAAFHETAEQFLYCANRASEFCWNNDDYRTCVTSKGTAERALYDELRAETDLHANLVQKAIRRAVEAVKSGVARWKKRKRTTQPHFDSWSIVYDKRSATFHRNYVSLSTVDGRAECEFVLPADSPTPFERYVVSDDYEFRMATLQYDRAIDEFYCHISTRTYESDGATDDSADTENQTVLGVDLGVNSLAVASTGTFWQGDEYDHWCREFEKRRATLQQRGTQAAHNALLRLGKREDAWRTQYLHTVASELATEALETNCDVIVFEDLTDIRERLPHAQWQHLWVFHRLYEYVAYKAPERGVLVDQVAPNHTSQRCSKCGFTHEDNRDGKHFHCLQCGYEVNAEYNAVARLHLAGSQNARVLATAKNIGLRYARTRNQSLQSRQTSETGDVLTNLRFVAYH